MASLWATALWRPLRWKLLEAWPDDSCQIPTCLGLGLAVFGPAPAPARPPKQRRLDRGAWIIWPALALALALRCGHCIFVNSHSLWPPFASCACARLPRRVRCRCCQTVPVNARCASSSWHCLPEKEAAVVYRQTPHAIVCSDLWPIIDPQHGQITPILLGCSSVLICLVDTLAPLPALG